jgi:hypothetical protein
MVTVQEVRLFGGVGRLGRMDFLGAISHSENIFIIGLDSNFFAL